MHYEKFADGTVKCIEDEIPFEVPEGWAWCRLEALAAPHENSFVDGPFGSNLKTDHYTSKREVRIIQLNNIGEFSWKNNGIKYTTFKHADTLQRCKSYPGDIVIAKMMPAGRAIIIPDIEEVYVISSDCVRLQLPCYVNNNYVMYMINSGIINRYILESVQGIGRSRTSLSKLKKILVPLPGLTEQDRIVKKINMLQKIVDNINDSIIDAEGLVRIAKAKVLDIAIRGKLVSQNPDDEPASVLLEYIRAEKDELIKTEKIKRNKKEPFIFRGEDGSYYLSGKSVALKMPFDIPDSWAWSNLQELCDYGNCVNISAEKIPKDAWILDLEDIEKGSGKLLQRLTNKERQSTSAKHPFHKNMILYSKLRPYLNKVVLADDDGYCTSEIIPLDFVKKIYPRYAQFFLMSPYFVDYANRCSYGMKMPRLGTKDGRNAYFAIPPYNEQIRIANYIENIFNVLYSIENNIV